METKYFLAFDLGAESGRAMLGQIDEAGRLKISERHRFPNRQVQINGRQHWNLYYLFEEICQALKKIRQEGINLSGLGLDTWGVDFGLLDRRGHILTLPYSYRDRSFPPAMKKYFENYSAENLYQKTGIQFMPFNSLFQLYAYLENSPEIIKTAHKLLFMPDLLNYLLTGEIASEITIASTSQMLSPFQRNWLPELLEEIGLVPDILPPLRPTGSVLGQVADWLVEDGLPAVPVIQVASHDTASAVAAAPGEGQDWVYISSGTWSLVGVELKEPVVNRESFMANFTNESGLARTIRFLKNVSGLWILQQCRKIWCKKQDVTYENIVERASRAAPFQFLLDPDAPDFLNPENMLLAMSDYAEKTGQKMPEDLGSVARSVLESLALKYRLVLEDLEKITGWKYQRIHIIGGGAKNKLLNQFTASATGKTVFAGPEEATSVGNILVQALAAGLLKNQSDIRSTIRKSFEIKEFKPEDTAAWDKAYSRFQEILSRTARII
ncbi:MAG: rhamnulokinase [Candidatus Aminicenantes bacterium]|nr:rhamnulokinase [Candidatus Aminicenantes bacterium]